MTRARRDLAVLLIAWARLGIFVEHAVSSSQEELKVHLGADDCPLACSIEDEGDQHELVMSSMLHRRF